VDDVWWKTGIIYQIYPRSFQDSDGDGIGDLAGIRRRLHYVAELGVEAIWISPIYPSPMADFGYDVMDYCDIDPRFGSLQEFDRLVADARRHGLEVILDFVPNHSSDRHPWFVESRRSRSSARRNWYIWRDPGPGGGPPNNWLSHFGGSAWEFDAATGQYYYHAFLKEQPDLNWRNPEVRGAMHDVLRFWLRRGVAGFRVDVIDHLIKDDQYRDNPPAGARASGTGLDPLYTTDRPELADVIAGMRGVLEEFAGSGPPRILIGEAHVPLARLMAYYGRSSAGVLDGVQLPFNFHLIGAAWEAGVIDRLVRDYEAALPVGAWPNWVLGNHDERRIASRVGAQQARVAAMLLLTLRGTPTLYYGDEIGMTDVAIPFDEIQDPFKSKEPGGSPGRDPQRTPMQWDGSPNAGFTTASPWLRLGPDWPLRNVAALGGQPGSILDLYRRLIALRRSSPPLNRGAWEPLQSSGPVLAYARVHDGRRMTVALNLSAEPVVARLAGVTSAATVRLSTYLDRQGGGAGPDVELRAGEGVVIGEI